MQRNCQRTAFLRKKCGKDDETLSEVLSLLRHHQDETVIEKPAGKTRMMQLARFLILQLQQAALSAAIAQGLPFRVRQPVQ